MANTIYLIRHTTTRYMLVEESPFAANESFLAWSLGMKEDKFHRLLCAK